MCIEEIFSQEKRIEQKRMQLKKMTTPMPMGRKQKKVDGPLHGTGSDRNGWGNDGVRSR